MNPNGRPARPHIRLRDAAILYAECVEAEGGYEDHKRAWDRLRIAAIRYRKAPKHKGRPRNAET
jgi:hypothetical protein